MQQDWEVYIIDLNSQTSFERLNMNIINPKNLIRKIEKRIIKYKNKINDNRNKKWNKYWNTIKKKQIIFN